MSNQVGLRRVRQRGFYSAVLLEQLESRELLSTTALFTHATRHSVSLAPAVVSPHIPSGPALTSTILSSKIPTALILNGDFASVVQVNVVNSGNAVTPAGSSVNVTIYLRPAGTNGESDVQIGAQAAAFGNVKDTTGSKKVNVKVTVAAGQGAGSYTLVAKATPSGFAPGQNTDGIGATIQITQGFVSLQNTIASSTLPGTITSSTKSAVVKVTVVNTGNVVTLKAAKITVTIALQPTGGGAAITLGAKSGQAFANVKAGTGLKTVSISIKLSGAIGTGSYTLMSTTTPIGFAPTVNNVIAGTAVSVSAGTSGGTNFLDHIGNTVTVTDLIDTNTQVFQNLGSTTSQHWHFVDNLGNTGEMFVIQNSGKIAQSVDASIQFFAGGIFTQGSVALKGKDAGRAFVVGTQLTFGTSGSIACTIDSFTNGTCKVARVN